jgi:hypothetical protein
MIATIPEHSTPNQVLVVVTGEVSVREMLEFIEESRSGGLRRCAFLFDVSAAAIGASGDEVRQLAMYAARQGRQAPMGPVAFISTDPATFGMSRMYQAYSVAEGRRNVGVFRSMAEAQTWLATLPGCGD